jgi:uncharacterized membrane protein
MPKATMKQTSVEKKVCIIIFIPVIKISYNVYKIFASKVSKSCQLAYFIYLHNGKYLIFLITTLLGRLGACFLCGFLTKMNENLGLDAWRTMKSNFSVSCRMGFQK